jgi:hypothetical protein
LATNHKKLLPVVGSENGSRVVKRGTAVDVGVYALRGFAIIAVEDRVDAIAAAVALDEAPHQGTVKQKEKNMLAIENGKVSPAAAAAESAVGE